MLPEPSTRRAAWSLPAALAVMLCSIPANEVVAGRFAGFSGLLLAVPRAALACDACLYGYRRRGDEPAEPTLPADA